MHHSAIVNKKGEKSVPVWTGGNEKQRCEVMLCMTADWSKLNPFVIFKWRMLPIVDIKGVVVMEQERG